MIVGDLKEIAIVGVHDRGMPNRERIEVKTIVPINMGRYGIMLGVIAGTGLANPIPDQLFWFGDATLSADVHINIYTGPGIASQTPIPGLTMPAFNIYWGKMQTI